MTLLISNVTVFCNDDQDGLHFDYGVLVEGNEIRAVGPSSQLRHTYSDFEELDGAGRLLMPGLVNVHMHFYGTFARGLKLLETPSNFPEILKFLWWKLDRSLDPEAIYYSALLPAISAIRHGCTSVIDHHASPNAVEGSLDQIEEALSRVGLRALLCYEVSDRDGKEVRNLGLQENERYIRKCRAQRAAAADHLYDGMMGLHAAFTLEDDSLSAAAQISSSLECGCHIHLLEDRADQEICLEKYGMGAVERLARHHILGEKSIAAHGIHLDQSGLETLARTKTIVTHQPQSNMNNAVGCAPVLEMLRKGITVGIGSDGMSADIRSEIRTGYLLQKHHLQNCSAGWVEFEKMAMKNNPAIYRRLTGRKIGRIAEGYLADLILVDYRPPTPMTAENFWGHFLYGVVDAPVDCTIINGNIVMREGKVSEIDEAEVTARALSCARRVWDRFRR